MMHWNGNDGDHMDGAWGWLGGTMMILSIVLLVLLILALASWLMRTRTTRALDGSQQDARAILDRRYASGEIDEETYRRMRDEVAARLD